MRRLEVSTWSTPDGIGGHRMGGRRNKTIAVSMLVGALVGSSLALASARAMSPALLSPALKIVITDPDENDRSEGRIRIRTNDGRQRLVVEADIIAEDEDGNRLPIPPGTIDITITAQHSTEGTISSDPTGPLTPTSE